MDIALRCLTLYLTLIVGLYLLCTFFNCFYYRRARENGTLIPMTVIKPMRGWETKLEGNLLSLLESDREGALQIIFAVESESDTAYPAALRAQQAFASRDIHLLITGPSRERMGKIHNMIEALKFAKHPYVVFSDSDVRTTRTLLCETSRAFQEGADLICAVPYALTASNLGETMLGFCFNHYLASTAAAMHRVGVFHSFAGGWMGFSRLTLEKLGGLGPFERHIADDYAVSQAALKAGARPKILPCVASIYEETAGIGDAFKHILKWSLVVRYAAPGLAFVAPLCTPTFLSGILLLASFGSASQVPIAVFLAVVGLRIISAYAQDRIIANARFPLWAYPLLPLLDLALMGVGFISLFKRTIAWRGKTYRLLYGGQVEVVS